MSRRNPVKVRPGRDASAAGGGAGLAVTVFIIGDVWLYGEGLTRVLSNEGSLDVLGAGPPDESSLHRIAGLRPRVVLIDSGSARGAGFVRRALTASPGCRVVALGVKNDESEVLGCAEAGVEGYIGANASAFELAESLRTLQCGAFPCPATTASILLRHLDRPSSSDHLPERADSQLTKRENDIITLVDRGFTNKEIAAALSIAVPTVKNHVHHILEKLGVERRGAAAAKLRPRTHGQEDLDPGPHPEDLFTRPEADARVRKL